MFHLVATTPTINLIFHLLFHYFIRIYLIIIYLNLPTNYFLVCQCQRNEDCRGNLVCDDCNCVLSLRKLPPPSFTSFASHSSPFAAKEPVFITGCEHCPPGVQCNPLTGACIKGRSSESGKFCVTKNTQNIKPNLFIVNETCNTYVLLFCINNPKS